MIELIDTKPDIHVQESEYARLLGYPRDHELSGRARELADWAMHWYGENGRPWVYVRTTEAMEIVNSSIRLDGVDFLSPKLHAKLQKAEAHSAALAVVTAGKECEDYARQLWLEEKPDEYFFLEMYGSAVVEHLIAATSWRLCDWADQNQMAVLPHYSPGYSGWDINDQSKLWDVIRHSANLPEEIQVMPTGMLNPKKSLLAVFGITRNVDRVSKLTELIPCESCSLPNCQYRRTPYRHFRNQIEDVRQLQPQNGQPTNGAALDIGAKYSVSHHALHKWSRERLQLEFEGEGSVAARFRYEGTTCSNLGRRLEYDYYLKLSQKDNYKIMEMKCTPAPGDSGHSYMCQYLNAAQQLERAIADEKPLLGYPLNDVLTWKRQFSPAGCYCDSISRLHKWGLVLEVVHFALAQKLNCEKEEDKIVELQP